jgi:YidC/Oxa1 family membrane protein insertase
VFDKMTPNQRLLVAVLLSVVFFTVYTAIFPPVEPELAQDAQNNKEVATKTVETNVAQTDTKRVEDVVNHEIAQAESTRANDLNTLLTVKSKNFILKMDTLGRISSMELLEEKRNTKDDTHSQIISPTGTKPLYLRFLDPSINDLAIKTPYTVDSSSIDLDTGAKTVTLTQNLANLKVTKKITFYPDAHYDVDISLSQDKRYFVYLGQRPKVNEQEQMMAAVGALVYSNEDLLTIIEDGDAEGRKTFSNIALAAAFDQYNATIMYNFGAETNVIIERDRDNNPVVYFDAMQKMKFNGYVGPKEYKTLKSIDPILTNAIEYGWFTFASKPLFALLSWLHGIFGNWGWAIIALTLLIRAVLYPLTYKGMVSMQKMKAISPKVKELQAKYKGDPQRMNQAVMGLYKKHGANPLGGCLPMLLQIPVFFAIYRVLLNAVELQGAPWILWVTDLSRMDNTFVLPILMGASMYYQQKLTPSNFTDPMQEKVFKFLPIIFTFFFVTFPSGLVLYWFVNNLFSIAQQFIVNAQFKNAQDAQAVIEKHEAKKESGKKDD